MYEQTVVELDENVIFCLMSKPQAYNTKSNYVWIECGSLYACCTLRCTDVATAVSLQLSKLAANGDLHTMSQLCTRLLLLLWKCYSRTVEQDPCRGWQCTVISLYQDVVQVTAAASGRRFALFVCFRILSCPPGAEKSCGIVQLHCAC